MSGLETVPVIVPESRSVLARYRSTSLSASSRKIQKTSFSRRAGDAKPGRSMEASGHIVKMRGAFPRAASGQGWRHKVAFDGAGKRALDSERAGLDEHVTIAVMLITVPSHAVLLSVRAMRRPWEMACCLSWMRAGAPARGQ